MKRSRSKRSLSIQAICGFGPGVDMFAETWKQELGSFTNKGSLESEPWCSLHHVWKLSMLGSTCGVTRVVKLVFLRPVSTFARSPVYGPSVF